MFWKSMFYKGVKIIEPQKYKNISELKNVFYFD